MYIWYVWYGFYGLIEFYMYGNYFYNSVVGTIQCSCFYFDLGEGCVTFGFVVGDVYHLGFGLWMYIIWVLG